ncbi:MAG: UDP-N-acetylmuramoyl-tripeptide--D-alanyl-D-alanine ligase, partial [Clostridia bacterium]|nr:UDP-N-acetylmuramoyl-tripeptide--D-alanyl-D-alanine ligase [Clostridia bacterium]
TNIGMSHIENLGSQEGIYKAKTEICNYFDKNSVLIVNGDDKFLIKAKEFKKFSVITYGIENKECDYRASDIENLGIEGTRFKAKIYGREYEIHVKTPGVHNVYNALAAIACGVHYNIAPQRIVAGIEDFSLTKMRMAIEKTNELTIINDCYNSSPDSVNAALKVLATQNTRRVAILGDILEMGDFAKEAHFKIGQWVYDNGVDVLVAVGDNSKHIAEGAKEAGMEDVIYFADTDEACEDVLNIIQSGDSVLVKASRGMHFEKIVDVLKGKE